MKEGLILFGVVLIGILGELIEDYYIKVGFVLWGILVLCFDDIIGFVFIC